MMWKVAAPVALVVTLGLVVALSSGCSTSIKSGTAKNEVLKRYGRPDGWYVLKPATGEIREVTYWSGPAEERDMPSDEIWVFEYKTRHGGRPACLWVKNGVVDQILDGPFYKQNK